MPLINQSQNLDEREETQNENNEEEEKERLKEEDDEEIKEKKSKFYDGAEGDKVVKQVAEKIYNKMFSIKNEEVDEEEEQQNYSSVQMEKGEGFLNFISEGNEKTISIYPNNPKVKYSMEIQSEDGETLSIIPNLMSVYKAKINTFKGNYKLVVKSPESNMPFIIRMQ
jgi:hypothetical protein